MKLARESITEEHPTQIRRTSINSHAETVSGEFGSQQLIPN